MNCDTKPAEQLGYGHPVVSQQDAELPPSYDDLMASGAFDDTERNQNLSTRRTADAEKDPDLERWEDESSGADTDEWDYGSQTLDTRSQATSSSFSSERTSTSAQTLRSTLSERRQERREDRSRRREEKRAAWTALTEQRRAAWETMAERRRAAWEARAEQSRSGMMEWATGRPGLKARIIEQKLMEKESKRAEFATKHGLR